MGEREHGSGLARPYHLFRVIRHAKAVQLRTNTVRLGSVVDGQDDRFRPADRNR